MPRRAAVAGLVLVCALAAATGSACRGVGPPEFSKDEAAAALRSAPAFTARPGSPVGRELVEVLAVRRIGRSSIEVEFTWHDTALSPGQPPPPVKTSMALFRRRDTGDWGLASLYKVD